MIFGLERGTDSKFAFKIYINADVEGITSYMQQYDTKFIPEQNE